MPPRARTTKAADTADEDTTADKRTGSFADETVAYPSDSKPEPSYAGTFYEGFDDEEYPDSVMPSPGQILVFRVESSNIVPIENKRSHVLEDTEVVQITLLEGTDATVKIKVGPKEYEDTGELEPIGETRSLWINSEMLRKLWQKWNPEPGDVGALKFAGKVPGKRNPDNEYQKWFGKFDKPLPR